MGNGRTEATTFNSHTKFPAGCDEIVVPLHMARPDDCLAEAIERIRQHHVAGIDRS